MLYRALILAGLVIISAALTYDELNAVAQSFEKAIHIVHDTPPSPVAPSPAQCEALSALFAPDALVTSAGSALPLNTFCQLWALVGVTQHTTTFANRMVSTAVSQPCNASAFVGQTIGWFVVDSGVTSTNCSFNAPNVAWARVDPTSGLIVYLEFVTDQKTPCF
jgi:hypothetical protein